VFLETMGCYLADYRARVGTWAARSHASRGPQGELQMGMDMRYCAWGLRFFVQQLWRCYW